MPFIEMRHKHVHKTTLSMFQGFVPFQEHGGERGYQKKKKNWGLGLTTEDSEP